MGQPVRLPGRARQLQRLQSRASPVGKPVQQGLDFFGTGFWACFRFMGRKLPLREPAKIIRASGLRPRSGQALAAERLRADDSADLVAIDIHVADFQAADNLFDPSVNPGMHGEGEAVSLRVD